MNYFALGLIIERVSGRTYYDELRRRILDPLKLDGITPANRRDIPNIATGYVPEDNRFMLPHRTVEKGRLVYDPEMEWTGGGLAARAGDLARWAMTLYGGHFMSSDYLKTMRDEANGNKERDGYLYGPGVQYMTMSSRDILGHGGWMFGYTAGMYYFPKDNVAVSIQINAIDRSYAQYAEQVANGVLDWLND